jgi:hypothetical protein
MLPSLGVKDSYPEHVGSEKNSQILLLILILKNFGTPSNELGELVVQMGSD